MAILLCRTKGIRIDGANGSRGQPALTWARMGPLRFEWLHLATGKAAGPAQLLASMLHDARRVELSDF